MVFIVWIPSLIITYKILQVLRKKECIVVYLAKPLRLIQVVITHIHPCLHIFSQMCLQTFGFPSFLSLHPVHGRVMLIKCTLSGKVPGGNSQWGLYCSVRILSPSTFPPPAATMESVMKLMTLHRRPQAFIITLYWSSFQTTMKKKWSDDGQYKHELYTSWRIWLLTGHHAVDAIFGIFVVSFRTIGIR